VSNKREASLVFAYKNDLNNYSSGYYGVRPSYNKDSALIKLEKNLNPETAELYWFWPNDKAVENGEYGKKYNPYTGKYTDYTEQDSYIGFMTPKSTADYTSNQVPFTYYYYGILGADVNNTKRTLYSLKTWRNYFLQNFIIPFPKGYVFNGRKIKENCLIDILTGEIFFPAIYHPIDAKGNETASLLMPPIITPLGERVDYSTTNSSMDNNLTFNKSDINKFLTILNNNTRNFRMPSETASTINVFNKDVIIPAFAKTEDAENGIEGLWYSDNKAWFQGYKVSLVAAETYPETLKPENLDVAVKGDTHNTATNVTRFMEPDGERTNGNIQSEQVVHIYASYKNRYWTGTEWIEKDMTENNVSAYPNTKNYVVSIPLLKVYSNPVANDAYRLITIQNGDRLTVNKYLTRDEAWKYAEDLGWIDTTDAVSEVI
jgi:hypothetical protein